MTLLYIFLKSTAVELLPDPKKAQEITIAWDFRAILAVEFQLERCQYIKLELYLLFYKKLIFFFRCEMSLEKEKAINLGYTIFAISELVICKNGLILRQLV